MSNVSGAVYIPSGPMYLRNPKAMGFPKLVSLPKASLLGGWTTFEDCRQVHNEEFFLSKRLRACYPVSAGPNMSCLRGGCLMPAVAWSLLDSKKL